MNGTKQNTTQIPKRLVKTDIRQEETDLLYVHLTSLVFFFKKCEFVNKTARLQFLKSSFSNNTTDVFYDFL